jgi:histidyl-tRNA synthetase
MNDILPAVSGTWRYLESEVRDIVQSYGYNEMFAAARIYGALQTIDR